MGEGVEEIDQPVPAFGPVEVVPGLEPVFLEPMAEPRWGQFPRLPG